MRLALDNYTLDSLTRSSGTSPLTSYDLDKYKACAIQVTITDTVASAKGFAAGVAEVATVTFPSYAAFGENDYVIVTAQDGLAYAVSGVKLGGVTEPTGPLWAAIPAGRKALVDLTGLVTNIQLAAAFEVAFDALTGFTAKVVTDDTAADGTMLFTQAVRGVVANPVPKNATDGGAGSITIAETTAGVNSDVNVTSNVISETAHGWLTGLKGRLTTTGTLPAGLSLATDYFVIKVDADSYKLASSLANAEAGTGIDITNQGDSGNTHTFTPTTGIAGTLKLQGSNDNSSFGDILGPLPVPSVSISAAGVTLLNLDKLQCRYIRLHLTTTTGEMSLLSTITLKEPHHN